jgi:hypothetical protein
MQKWSGAYSVSTTLGLGLCLLVSVGLKLVLQVLRLKLVLQWLDSEMAARSHMSPHPPGLRGKPRGNTRKHSHPLKSTANGSYKNSEQGQSVGPEKVSKQWRSGDGVGELRIWPISERGHCRKGSSFDDI